MTHCLAGRSYPGPVKKIHIYKDEIPSTPYSMTNQALKKGDFLQELHTAAKSIKTDIIMSLKRVYRRLGDWWSHIRPESGKMISKLHVFGTLPTISSFATCVELRKRFKF